MAVVLNFTGLVAAFVAFALIFLQADYELSFDKCHPTADRVFRVDKKGDESLFRNILPRGFVDDIIGSSAHICLTLKKVDTTVNKNGTTNRDYSNRETLFESKRQGSGD